MKIKLKSDVYNISKRVKEIDYGYYVVYDTSKSKFEIHCSTQVGTSYCLTLPYSCLDERALNYIHKTKSTNIDRILDKIDNDNKQLESAEKTSAQSAVCELMEEQLRS